LAPASTHKTSPTLHRRVPEVILAACEHGSF
jgi:hypothetical protein